MVIELFAVSGRQNQDWTTLGILRLLCSSNRFCIAFSQPAHITTLLNIVKKLVSNDSASSGSRASSVYIQVCSLSFASFTHFERFICYRLLTNAYKLPGLVICARIQAGKKCLVCTSFVMYCFKSQT